MCNDRMIIEKCLLYIQNYGSGTPENIANTFGINMLQVFDVLRDADRDGLLHAEVGPLTEQTKYVMRPEIQKRLGGLLEKILDSMSEAETQKYYRQRRRPINGRAKRP